MAAKENDFVELRGKEKNKKKFQGEAQKKLQQQIFIVIFHT